MTKRRCLGCGRKIGRGSRCRSCRKGKKRQRNQATKLRTLILKRDGFRCTDCGKRRSRKDNVTLEVHHLIPLSEGGQSRPDNMTTLCTDCHQRVSRNQRDYYGW